MQSILDNYLQTIICKCDPLSLNEKGHVSEYIGLLAVAPVLMHIIPDIQVEGDIIFDLEQTILCNLKYVVLFRTIPVFYQLTIQKAIQGGGRKSESK